MHERLIELWLDSASERAYQPAFVQMLVREGHRVLHSTRHGPLEFGKDVITVAPDGVACAYQLKGNPNGRLNRTQFRDIQPQLQELVATAITYPGAPGSRHRSYLVTNGFIEEDVILLIRQMNETWRRQGFGEEALRVLTRGDLLSMAQRAGTDFWPFSLKGIEGVITMLGHRGDAPLPLPKVHAILSDIYALDETAELLGTPELERRLPVAALLISISLRNFADALNHYAVVSAWVLYFAYTVAALERHQAPGLAEPSLRAARDATYAALGCLASEATGREAWVEGQTWVDTEFVPVRGVLVNALLSIWWIWSRSLGDGIAEAAELDVWLDRDISMEGIWGEGVIPQLLAHHWYLESRAPQRPAARRLGSLLNVVVASQAELSGLTPLPPPYYGADDSLLHRNKDLLPGMADPIGNDHYAGQSFAALGLVHLAAQVGAKDRVKAIWPHLTRLVHRSFRPALPWQFCLVRSRRGRDEEVILPHRGDWAAVRATALEPSLPGVPPRLAAEPLMLLLFAVICPHRLTPAVARHLGLALGSSRTSAGAGDTGG